jgi:hypothetical protein
MAGLVLSFCSQSFCESVENAVSQTRLLKEFYYFNPLKVDFSQLGITGFGGHSQLSQLLKIPTSGV